MSRPGARALPAALMVAVAVVAAAAATAVSGCKGSASAPDTFGVNVTIDAKSLSAADRAKVASGTLQVSGAESVIKTLDIKTPIQSGELRFHYTPNVQTGSLSFAFAALDSTGGVLASGSASAVTLTAGKAVAVKITLGSGTGRPNGTACATGSECASTFCADGVCCNEACDGVCASCALAASKGTCTAHADNTDPDMECGAKTPPPADSDGGAGGSDGGGGASADGGGSDAPTINSPDGGINTTPAMCAGTCNGARACRYPTQTKSCGQAFCNTDSQVASFACNGNGGCSVAFAACSDYTCDGTTGACKTRCSAHTDCAPTNFCNASSVCAPKKGMGVACATDPECGSGHCAQGVCCNSQCDTPNSCNTAPVGQCKCPGVTCAAGVACKTFYRDGDVDGYGTPSMTQAGCEGSPPAGYVDNNTDCDDGDANAHPGQTNFFGVVSRGTGTYDYNCDGKVDKQTPEYPGGSCRFCGPSTACGTGTSTCNSANQQATLTCTMSTYLCTLCQIGQPCNNTCTCCGCSGGILRITYLSSGFTATVACGATANTSTCNTCAAAGGTQTTTLASKQQLCH